MGSGKDSSVKFNDVPQQSSVTTSSNCTWRSYADVASANNKGTQNNKPSRPNWSQQQHRRSPNSKSSSSPPPVLLASGRIHEPPKPEELPTPPKDWLEDADGARAAVAKCAESDDSNEQRPETLQQQCLTATQALKQLLHLQS
ncbi:hypothetical protein BOX15_Mlig028989g1 [Macrostomum lignano]|uniref:Uncharacterized protein n=1 Tax=Macrostomum lignano TaxID=282301 RepID=A0A267H352_9PLAT|nr:hypothetical protein BOX15_Mlig028989g1 [Macrostomum lignano]